MERRLAAILAADVVGYSRLMERDEAGTHERLKAGRKELFEPEIARRHGRIFKLMGDGLLAEFASVIDAVECAVSLQRGLIERNEAVPEEHRIQVRIGINLGEIIVEGEDRYGEGVNIAARLQELAKAGGICVSGKVAKEVEKKLAFGFEPMGEQKVKNMAEPVQAFRLTLDGAAAKRLVAFPAKRLWPWAAAISAVAILAAVWFTVMKPAEPPRSADIPSIAVLPFDDMSPEKNFGYLGDGVADDIISMLARAPDVSVVARNSSFTYRGKATDVRQIGKELGVGYVLEGSVRKEADKIRIIAQLIDARSDEHVWAERYDKASTDPWALQDEVTGQIIATLAGETGQLKKAQYREAWGKDTTSLGEYDYYLRGHDNFMSSVDMGDRAQFDRAGEMWREGLAKYPDSDLLKISLGWHHYSAPFNFWSDNADADYREAGRLAREVIAHDNLSPLVRKLAHWLMAFVLAQERNFEGARKEATVAAELAPYDAQMLANLAVLKLMVGDVDEALEWLDSADARDPSRVKISNYKRGWAYTLQNRNEEAVAMLKQGADFVDTPLLLALNYVRLGRLDEARSSVQTALKIDPTFTQARWRAGYFYSDPSIVEREVTDLAKAGLPEK